MKKRQQILLCLFAQATLTLSSLSIASAIAAPAGTAAPVSAVQQYNISGPFCSDNLAVYLIRGPQKLKGVKILTLEEALSEKLVVVEETSNVNQLLIQNKSDCAVFLQSGDIVRGGKQDRAVQFDMMLAPHSGKIPLPCFCVEHNRWQQRGLESAGGFSSSSNQLAGKDLKLAAKKYGDQGAVWDNVSAVQGKLSSRLGPSACASPSPSSLELTMDNEKVKAATKQHLSKLADIAKGQNDVIGYAFAINGKISAADVYASNALFNKLWPKLLKSSAAEAVADADKKNSAPAPKTEEIKQFLTDAESKPVIHKSGDKQYDMTEQESSKSVMYKTNWFAAPRSAQIIDGRPQIHDSSAAAAAPSAPMVHANYINK